MQYITAGESHGSELTAIVTGVPAGLSLSQANLNSDLARRQAGYGRGDRQKIEKDAAIITGGVRFGKTTGAPVCVKVINRDWENWASRMAPFGNPPDGYQREVTPRPGHADLVGALRTNTDDCRNILERSSARETAARVAAGAIAKEFLGDVGVDVFSYVISIGDASMDAPDLDTIDPCQVEFSEVRCPDEEASARMMAAIDEAAAAGESLGGTFRVVATGLIPGLGSYVTGGERLTSRLGGAVFSIPAIKGVEFGMGFGASRLPGSCVHDEIVLEEGHFRRTSNNAGGLEGGMTTGEPLVITAAMKPIPTLMTPLRTVDLDTLEEAQASRERSDVCAVPACAVVAEAEVALVLADAYTRAFGDTSMADLKASMLSYLDRISTYSR